MPLAIKLVKPVAPHCSQKSSIEHMLDRATGAGLMVARKRYKDYFLTQLARVEEQTSTAGIPACYFASCSFNDGCCKEIWSWKSWGMSGDLLGKEKKKLSNNLNKVECRNCGWIYRDCRCKCLHISLRSCLGGLLWGTLAIWLSG